MWSLLGVKKSWVTPWLVSFKGLIQNFHRASPPFHMRSVPTPVWEIHLTIVNVGLFNLSMSDVD